MNSSEEFVVGKHNIGYINPRFSSEFLEKTFEEKATPARSITLSRNMKDIEIESELKPNLCSLGDVYALLESTDEKYRDGYANLFYFEACVVHVHWSSGYGYWFVDAWERDGSGWGAGNRVFSPVTGAEALGTLNSEPLSFEASFLGVKITSNIPESVMNELIAQGFAAPAFVEWYRNELKKQR